MKKEINKDIVKFDLKRLKGKKVVVNCRTEEQFQNYANWVSSLKDSNTKNNYWEEDRENSCLELSSELCWSYCNTEWYEELDYEIISYEEALLKEPKEQHKETSEEVPPLDKDEAKLLVEFLQNKINLTKETYERDINRYTSLMNKYQNILKGDL